MYASDDNNNINNKEIDSKIAGIPTREITALNWLVTLSPFLLTETECNGMIVNVFILYK